MNNTQNTLIKFETRWLLPFEEFLVQFEDKIPLNHKKKPTWPFYKPDNTHYNFFPWYEFDGVKIELDHVGFWYIQELLRKKELLYILYHSIFSIPLYLKTERTYSPEENTVTEYDDTLIDEWDYNVQYSIINSFELSEFSKNNTDFPTKTFDISLDIPTPLHPTDEYDVAYKLWEWKKRYFYRMWENEIQVSPILIYTPDSIYNKDLLKVFSKIIPNKDYISEDTEEAEISLRTWEIFEYFVSSSLHARKANVLEARNLMKNNGIDDSSLSDAILEEQLWFINNLLSNILK